MGKSTHGSTRSPRTRRSQRLRLLLSALSATPALAAAAVAIGAPNPLNDLFALGQAGGDSPARAPIQQPKEPPFKATPVAKCGPGSHKEPSVDGRVPAGSAAHGLNCNITLIGHQGTEGGFKVFRYVDPHGHVCAYYDQTLMLPLNALNPGANFNWVSYAGTARKGILSHGAVLSNGAWFGPYQLGSQASPAATLNYPVRQAQSELLAPP